MQAYMVPHVILSEMQWVYEHQSFGRQGVQAHQPRLLLSLLPLLLPSWCCHSQKQSQSRRSTASRPASTVQIEAFKESPVLGTSEQAPVPARIVEVPVTTFSVQAPVPAITVQAPVLTCTAQVLVPSRTAQDLVPTRTAQVSVPTHTAQAPVPTRSTHQPAPVPMAPPVSSLL